MKDLHLKYHCETGVSHEREIEAYFKDEDGFFHEAIISPDNENKLTISTAEYLSWLEEIAEKYFKLINLKQ